MTRHLKCGIYSVIVDVCIPYYPLKIFVGHAYRKEMYTCGKKDVKRANDIKKTDKGDDSSIAFIMFFLLITMILEGSPKFRKKSPMAKLRYQRQLVVRCRCSSRCAK